MRRKDLTINNPGQSLAARIEALSHHEHATAYTYTHPAKHGQRESFSFDCDCKGSELDRGWLIETDWRGSMNHRIDVKLKLARCQANQFSI